MVEPYFYCAANAIDWSLPALRIGDRQKPLKEKTLARIRIGLEKFGAQAMALDTSFGDGSRAALLSDAMRTQTTRQTMGLVMPPFLMDVIHTPRDDGKSMVFPVDGPHRTQIGQVSHALIIPYYTNGSASSVGDALPTVTTLDRHALAVPPFIIGYYTRVAGIQAAVSGIDDPVPTQSTQPRHYLVQPGAVPEVDDCGFRMLHPHEIQAAMAFPEGYRVLGNNREKVRQLGNAVTPPVMQMLVERIVRTL